MDLVLIEKLMRLLEASDLQELDVNEGGMRIRLAKKRSGNAIQEAEPAVATSQPPRDTPVEQLTSHRIIAGMAGTFYRSPSPGAPPFVTEGAEIRDGQQLGIIEAMKMLNPVEADMDGVIVRILLKDGDSVSPGTGLFEVEPR
ncbi:acetyl-CoA carboxylase biotin carboxyl carrier protein [Rhizobium sp. TH2]|uniref:acetyl-CoA carboxylase biotin carboxyl carrier protein n=1 Tax=Rhizobium sp. TH2 TaxID=2775403 RepID=UPI0021570B78|nr:biotin/lipoyl-containing protein [Rhizobium sp. TH2]UVC08764.1 acetyl-CoA carboxylase biotin carboxyl carrier protein [Rhizobium sp. TH2]